MTSPQAIYVLRWLVRDTVRQAVATRIFWILLGVSALCTVFCLGVSIEGGRSLRPEGDFLYHPKTGEALTGPSHDLGTMNLLFGAFRVGLPRDRDSGVHLIHVILGTWVAGAVGLLVTLMWTAGFVPEFLQPSSSAVLFAKPVPRWLFLTGKYAGVVALVAFQAGVFFGGTWLALGLKTGVWNPAYLAGIPLLTLHFAVIFSMSVLLAVLTRSTVACVLGSVLFWGLCMCLNYARHAAYALPVLAPTTPALSSATLFFVDAAYWILPKPADFVMILENALNAHAHMTTLSGMPEFAQVQAMDAWEPAGAVFTSLLFSGGALAMAAHQLNHADY